MKVVSAKPHGNAALRWLALMVLLAGARHSEGQTPWVPRVFTNYVDLVTRANPTNANRAVYVLGGTNIADGWQGWFLATTNVAGTNLESRIIDSRGSHSWERLYARVSPGMYQAVAFYDAGGSLVDASVMIVGLTNLVAPGTITSSNQVVVIGPDSAELTMDGSGDGLLALEGSGTSQIVLEGAEDGYLSLSGGGHSTITLTGTNRPSMTSGSATWLLPTNVLSGILSASIQDGTNFFFEEVPSLAVTNVANTLGLALMDSAGDVAPVIGPDRILRDSRVSTNELDQLRDIGTAATVQAQIDGKQPLDADLTDLADGLLSASKVGTGSVDNTEFGYLDGVTSKIQVQLNVLDGFKQDADVDLTALTMLETAGLVARTGGGTAAARSITGDSEIVVGNGDGVSGNPTLSLGAGIARDAEVAAGYQPLDADLTDLADGVLTGSKVGSGISGGNITSGTVASARIDSAQATDAEVAAGYQPLDADLTDLADGSLTGTKVGFADTDGNFAAANLQGAIEELDNVNFGGPNASDGKVEWSQLVGVPAGFADGNDSTVAPDSVVLGSDTTGNYVASVAGDSEVTASGSGESANVVLALGAGVTRDTEWDTLGEIETHTGGGNILTENEIDGSSELATLMDDETGTGALVFGTTPQFTTGIGIGAVPSAGTPINVVSDLNNGAALYIRNPNAGSFAYTAIRVLNDANQFGGLSIGSANYNQVAERGYLKLAASDSTMSGILFQSGNVTSTYKFYIGIGAGSPGEMFRVDADGALVFGRLDATGAITQNGTAVSLAGHAHAGGDITSGTVASARIDSAQATDAEVSSAIAGLSSVYQGLDADLTDLADGSLSGSKVGSGISGGNITSGTVASARIDTAQATDAEVSSAIGGLSSVYQPLDADLTDLADGSLSGTKVGFADPDSNFAATDAQGAIAELDDSNGSGPNASDGKVSWSQLVGVPAGLADGTDDSGGLSDGDKGDISVSGGGANWSIDSGAVGNGEIRGSAGLSVIGRSADTFGSVADITAAFDGQVLRRSGTSLGFGQVVTVGIADMAVTEDKLADNAVGFGKLPNLNGMTVIGRNSGSAGDPEEVNISELLDWAGSVQGAILYRSASGWTVLTPGSAGQVLKSGGAAANPSWGTDATGSGGFTETSVKTTASFAQTTLHTDTVGTGGTLYDVSISMYNATEGRSIAHRNVVSVHFSGAGDAVASVGGPNQVASDGALSDNIAFTVTCSGADVSFKVTPPYDSSTKWRFTFFKTNAN